MPEAAQPPTAAPPPPQNRSTVGGALFTEPALAAAPPGVVVVRDVEFASTSCENLLPFYGRLHIAYVPGGAGVVLGLSKVARLAKLFSRRLTTQEALTRDVLAALVAAAAPAGAAVIVDAAHLAQGPSARACVTTAVAGLFEAPGGPDVAEFLALLRVGGGGCARGNTRAAAGWPAGPPTSPGMLLPATGGDRAPSPAAAPGTPSPGRGGDSAAAPSRAPPAADARASIDVDDAASSSYVHAGEIAAANRAAAALVHLPRPGRAVPPAARAAMEAAVRCLLTECGEDPGRPGLRGAPERYAAFLLASTAGYAGTLPQSGKARDESHAEGSSSPAPPPSPALPSWEASVRFTSQCEHHVLPFHGVARVLVVDPTREMTTAALEDVVATVSHRLQVQERLTAQLADAVAASTRAAGILVVADAAHMCMVSRGVEKHASSTVTLAARGCLAGGAAARRDALARWGVGAGGKEH